MKTILIAAALGSLAFAATPLSARVDGPKDLRDADKGCPTAGLLLPAVQKVREAPARSKRGHVKVFDGARGAGTHTNAEPDAGRPGRANEGSEQSQTCPPGQ